MITRNVFVLCLLYLTGMFVAPVVSQAQPPQSTYADVMKPAEKKVMRLYILAMRCLTEVGDLPVAIEGLQACIRLDPSFVPAYLQLSSAYDHMQDWQASIRTLTTLLEVEKDEALRSRIQRRIEALNQIKSAVKPFPVGADRMEELQARLEAGNLKEVLDALSSPDVGKREPFGLLAFAGIAQGLGSPSKALPLLDEALKQMPKASQANFKALREYLAVQSRFEGLREEAGEAMRRGNYADAFDAWHQVVRSPLVDRRAIEAFAFAADAIRQYGPAAATLEQRAAVLNGPLADVARDQSLRLMNRAALYSKARDLANTGRRVLNASPEYAARCYLAALKIDPTNADYLMGFALACRRERKPEAALEAVRQAAASGAYSTALAGGGAILSEGGARDEAAALMIRLSAEAAKRGADAQIELAEACIAAKSNADAMAILRQIPAESPRRGLVTRLRAQCLLADKNYPEAEAAFRQALEMEPQNGGAYADLAGTQLRQGRRDEAKKNAVEAIKRGVKDHWVFKELAGGKKSREN